MRIALRPRHSHKHNCSHVWCYHGLRTPAGPAVLTASYSARAHAQWSALELMFVGLNALIVVAISGLKAS